jgi:hypothetical protein
LSCCKAFTVNPIPAGIGSSTITNFSTPGAFTYTVPAGVFSVNVSASGAQGVIIASGATGVGGSGGNVQGALTVTPGQQLFIFVGGQGGSLSGGTGGSSFGGGEDGGTGGTSSGGAGGGAASDVRTSITGGGSSVGSLNSRVFVGGGGGGANFSCSPHLNGAAGGFPAGGNGISHVVRHLQAAAGKPAVVLQLVITGNCAVVTEVMVMVVLLPSGAAAVAAAIMAEQVAEKASGAGGSSFAGTGTSGVSFKNGTQTGNGFVSISYLSATTSVCVGSTVTLSDATAGGTWSSSNPAVATIGSSTGVVTGVSSGTVVITYALVHQVVNLHWRLQLIQLLCQYRYSVSVCTGLTTTPCQQHKRWYLGVQCSDS